MNKRLAVVLMAAVTTLAGTGCVAQREADDLRTLYRRSQEQIIDLQAQLEEANARIAALQGAGASSAQLQELMSERDRLRAALTDAEARLREAGQQTVMLPEPLDSALRQLADQYPDLMSYDAERGMVRFRSDLTFPLGSAEVGPEARTSLNRLAEVLRGPAAEEYEVRIVGHTDAVPVTNPATRQRHPNNWFLSAHRAISVRDVLEQAGVQPVRLGVAGYGQYRPVAPAGPRGESEANRRVEIYLVQMPSGALQAAQQNVATQPQRQQQPEQRNNNRNNTAEAQSPEMFK
jgi:chemotaxis protein MotB